MVPKICSVDGCARPKRARGYCTRHYQQWQRNTPHEDRVTPTSEELFRAKIDAPSGGAACWNWLGCVDPETGYGEVRVNYRLYRAHRYSYELHKGPIPEGHVIDHACHNNSGCTDVPCAHRRCVNPSHLEAVTQSVNTSRGRTGEHNSSKTHCPQGHEYTPKNTAPQNNGRGRRCRPCSNARSIALNARRKAA